ncbi:MAG: hypothetical protein ABEK50_04760 [bacterium]
MVRAIAAGEIDLALTNHYYVLRLKYGGPEGEYEGEEDEEHEEAEEMEPTSGAPVKMYRFKQGDPGNLALVTGAGILTQSDRKKQARKFLKFLLSKKSQSFVAHKVKEYPVVTGTTVPEYMLPVEKALSLSPDFDPGSLSELDATLEMLRNEGVF